MKPKSFLSTPSARRATLFAQVCENRVIISIHALREEGDTLDSWHYGDNYTISIHALREEGDLRVPAVRSIFVLISIHALREEGDR